MHSHTAASAAAAGVDSAPAESLGRHGDCGGVRSALRRVCGGRERRRRARVLRRLPRGGARGVLRGRAARDGGGTLVLQPVRGGAAAARRMWGGGRRGAAAAVRAMRPRRRRYEGRCRGGRRRLRARRLRAVGARDDAGPGVRLAGASGGGRVDQPASVRPALRGLSRAWVRADTVRARGVRRRVPRDLRARRRARDARV